MFILKIFDMLLGNCHSRTLPSHQAIIFLKLCLAAMMQILRYANVHVDQPVQPPSCYFGILICVYTDT
jgi:hypothetical protein